MFGSNFKKYIDHKARVVNINHKNKIAGVTLIGQYDCRLCPYLNICDIMVRQTDIISVSTPLSATLKKGDDVILRATEQLPHKFLIAATVLPCLILILCMIIVFLITLSQAWALIFGIGVTLFIYLLIWVSRNRVPHEILFTIVSHPS